MYIQLYTLPMRLVGIEWDDGNLKKCQKHGVPVAEIDTLLLQSHLTILPDFRHSHTEDRFWGIGKTGAGRSIFLVFTLRHRVDGTYARPISARYMHQKEIAHYEKNSHL